MPQRVTIYGHNQCRWCHAAIQLAETLNLTVDYRDVRAREADFFELTKRLPDVKTVPQIFIGDAHIGGYSDFEAASQNGELSKLLAQ